MKKTKLIFLLLLLTIHLLAWPILVQAGNTPTTVDETQNIINQSQSGNAGSGTNQTPSGNNGNANNNPALTTVNETDIIISQPQLQIKIPGLNFSNPDDVKKLISEDSDKTYLSIPYLSEYIVAIYKYAIVVASIIATFIIMWNGFDWLFSIMSPDAIQNAKKRISQAMVGLLIALLSYNILNLLNPYLVNFKNLKINYVKPIQLGEVVGQIAGIDSMGNLEVTPITDPNFHHDKLPSDNKVTEESIKETADKLSIDECLLSSIILKESGGNLLATGHDEDFAVPGYPNPNGSGGCVPRVISRGNFLASGKKFSGATFPAITEAYDACKHNSIRVSNDDYDSRSASRKNPDKFIAPDYGLDWRYSHGIGLGQVTIFPYGGKYESENTKIEGPNGQEWARKIGGRWFTVTDLFNLDKTVEATMLIIKNCFKYAKTDLEKFYACYAGDEGGIPRGMKFYCSCLQKKGRPLLTNCGKYQ